MSIEIHTVSVPLPKFFTELDDELFFIGLRLTLAVRSFETEGAVLTVRLLDGFRDDRFLIGFLRRYGMTTRDLKVVAKKKTKTSAKK